MSDEFEKLAGTAPTLTLTPFPEKKEELPQKTEEQAVAEVKEKMEEESRFTIPRYVMLDSE